MECEILLGGPTVAELVGGEDDPESDNGIGGAYPSMNSAVSVVHGILVFIINLSLEVWIDWIEEQNRFWHDQLLPSTRQ